MSKIAYLFPGQGSQYVGMGQDLFEADPGARELFGLAEDTTGLPLKRLCFTGPMEELTLTVNLQPAVTVVNLCLYRALAKAGVTPVAVCGHSLGEYSALYAAGVLSANDTIAAANAIGDTSGGGRNIRSFANVPAVVTDLQDREATGRELEAVANLTWGKPASWQISITLRMVP